MEKINIRGVFFDNVTMDQALEAILARFQKGERCVVYTPNSEIVQLCVEDPSAAAVINGADLVVPDGAGVVLASRILKTPLKEKVAGIELAERLVEHAAKTGMRIFFYGSLPAAEGSPSVAALAAERLGQKYPGFSVCGTADGYQKPERYNDLIERVNACGTDCLFVCLGAPRQEKWIDEHKDKINAKILIGLGGSLDVFAGRVKRAPRLFIRLRLEWFYRLCKEPYRIGRMMKLPKFILGTIFSGRNQK